MKTDHFAYRVADRDAAAAFITESLGYGLQESFIITLEDGTTVESYAMTKENEPDIFISQGAEGSVIDEWVKSRGGIGGIHHIAYSVDDVAAIMANWRKRGLANFTTDEPIVGPGLVQAFTKPNPFTGIIYELISRDNGVIGFNPDNVKRLMDSTKGF